MAWWVWVLVGFLLLAGEMATPGGFYLLFFGVGALAVGLAALAGLELPGWGQWLLFSLLSIGLLVGVRPRILGRLHRGGQRAVDDSLVGEWVRVETRVEPGDLGRGELRGSPWTISNAGGAVLVPGDRCLVVRVEGLTLHVKKGE
ncbi:MAG TPA: NfeD family protein [Myxococcota bacterium]|jgi:membrane protein implicated in regulation of membrane protease activity|nr:NfeD family protein [Myxococcota bacterium]